MTIYIRNPLPLVPDTHLQVPQRDCAPKSRYYGGPPVPNESIWIGKEQEALEDILSALKDHFFLVEKRVQQWDGKAASHYLRWWVAELRRASTDVMRNGDIEIMRQDSEYVSWNNVWVELPLTLS
jgi:hypothetical protein